MSRAPTAVKRRRFTQRIIRRLVKQWVSVCPNKYNRWPWVMPFVLAANAPHFHPAKLYIESQSGYRFNWLTIGHGRGEQSREQSLLFSIHPSETAIHSSFVYVISISFVLRLDVFTESIEIYGSKRIFVFFSFSFLFRTLDPDSLVFFTKRRVRVAEHLDTGAITVFKNIHIQRKNSFNRVNISERIPSSNSCCSTRYLVRRAETYGIRDMDLRNGIHQRRVVWE